MKHRIEGKLLIGRQEWCQLPALAIPAIKAKIDTGAKTSAIHAFDVTTITRHGQPFVRFKIHPLQANQTLAITCEHAIIDQRHIISSNGHKELRYVISTELKLATRSWKIELTLSNRDPLRYRLLLGREALSHRVLIDPSLSCLQGKINSKLLKEYYQL